MKILIDLNSTEIRLIREIDNTCYTYLSCGNKDKNSTENNFQVAGLSKKLNYWHLT